MESPQLAHNQAGVTQGDAQQVTSRAGTTPNQKPNSTVKLGHDVHISQLMELCRLVWPSAQHDKTTIKDLGGVLNNVLEIVVTDLSRGTSKPFILRYPYKRSRNRVSDESFSSILLRQVAMLRWLERNTLLRTNRILCYDATENNPIGTPYMVQGRMRGVSLQDVLASPEGLSLEKRLDLARALGRLLRDLRCVTKSRAGTVVASGARPELSNYDPFIAIQPFGARSDGGEAESASLFEPVWLKAKDIVVNAFDRRILQLEACGDADRARHEYVVGSLITARGIMERLCRLGLFEDTDDNEFSLWHPDLSPRNIMVDLSQASDDMITGVLGWDDPAFAPSFVSCVPPVWLWAPTTHPVHSGDQADDPRETDMGYDLTEPETPEWASVKTAFDKEAGEFFVTRAYSRGYIYARALLRWVQIKGWPPPYEDRRREELLAECQAWLHSNELADSGKPDGADDDSGGVDGSRLESRQEIRGVR